MTNIAAIRIETVSGNAITALLPELARLRAVVFRDWPYLYDAGDSYESDYLRSYSKAHGSAIVVAMDGETAVGASTCLPMPLASPDVQTPFVQHGWDLSRLCYFGESVLLPEYRGRGIGVAFFAAREAHARSFTDAEFATFCAVRRPNDHPARPACAQPLDAFWRKRGYRKQSDLTCRMSWKEVGHEGEQVHDLDFWMGALRGAPVP